MFKRIILCFCFVVLNFCVYSQNLPSNLNDWYFWTQDETRHYVAEGGQGDSVIVIHGGWGAEYSYLVPALEPSFNKYHFTFYDQRGSLRSPAPDSSISLQRFIEDLDHLRKELGIDKVTLLSHSMGSYLAYGYLKKYPEHVKGMVLLSPVLPTGVNRERKKTADKKFVEFARSNEEKQLKEEGVFDIENPTDKERTHQWRIGYASGNIYHIDRWKQLKGGQAYFNPDIAKFINNNTTDSLMNNFIETLQKYSKPVRIIIGDHDLVDFGLTTWPSVAEKIPHITLNELDNAGHNSWIDRPKAFTNTVEKALKEITK